MDFPGALSERLGLTDAAAQGLAANVIGIIEDAVREAVSFGVASKIRDAVPELYRWQASTPTLPPGALHYDELDEWSAPGVTAEDAEFSSAMARFRVGPDRIPEVRALALQFLSSRLDAQTVAAIVKGVPHLAR
jgi:hypothetical protein